MSSMVEQVFSRLTASVRGQIFLCNLEAGIALDLIDPVGVRDVLDAIASSTITTMHEDDLLGYLRSVLQNTSASLLLQNDRSAHLRDFAGGDLLVTVMRAVDFDSYYADSVASISGHDFATRIAGSSTTRFRPSAATTAVLWVAPRRSFSPETIVRSDAEGARDELGLVHYGHSVPLVAMHFYPSTDRCYRPTAIEAVPNARFRQNDSLALGENRWGSTVNLRSLDTAPVGGDIAGVPELTLPRVHIGTCADVEFFQLGETHTDRDTARADRVFLSRLKNGENIDSIVSRLIAGLTT